MPPNSREWLARIKAVEREHQAMRLAAERLLADAARDPSILARGLMPNDVRLASGRLEGTYFIRLFAEFEAGLRRFWPHDRSTDPPGRTRDLLDGVAASRRVTPNVLIRAHAVREHRNRLVHLRDEPTAPISIAQARGHLCTFLGYLPPLWGS